MVRDWPCKYVIVIPDGCADDPQPDLQNRTPLQAAHLPHMDQLAREGRVGLADNVLRPLTPASDVATLSLFGYNPLEVYTGRAPLEAAALGINLGPRDWAIRCNLVTIDLEEMRDFTAGHISSAEGAALIQALQEGLGGPLPSGGSLELIAGVSYRNLLIYRSHLTEAPFSTETLTQPPHDIPDRPIQAYLPKGPGSDLLQSLMLKSRTILEQHPVNQKRIASGKKPANQIWLWGQGVAPHLEPFYKLHGIQGAIISAVDLVRGVGQLLGWKRIDVPGATGYLDTDYAAKGRYAVEALNHYDLVCVHIEAPDEASHEGNVKAKIEALERIDQAIVGPLRTALDQFNNYRILVSPDHRTTLQSRTHSYGMVPFVMAGTGIQSVGQTTYDEISASQSSLRLERGYELMRHFLN